MNLVVVHPDFVGQCHELDGRWIYADDDLAVYERVSSSLGSRLQPLITPAEFQAEVAGLRKEFVAWVDENLTSGSVEQWILTPLYKNPFSNNLFLHISWLWVVARFLKNQDADVIVITDSLGLSQTLRGICKTRVTFRSIRFSRLAIVQWYRNVKAIGGTVKRILELAARMVLSRRILGTHYKRRLTDVNILVATFVHDENLSSTGVFKNRYLPGLTEWYRQRGFSPAEYPSFSGILFRAWPSLYRRIKGSATRFVVFELFLTFSDLARSITKCLREALSRAKAMTTFRGIDVTPLVRSLRFRAALGGIVPLALTYAPSRLSETGIRPKQLVTWYENQVPDKANVIGFTRLKSPCRVIAVRQYDWVPNLISQFSTTREIQAGVSPRENWVCGQAMREGATAYDKVGNYRVVPALRYSHLYRDNHAEDRKEVCLSVLLTASIKESLGILTCVIEALPDLRRVFPEIHVKPHPDIGVEKMLSTLEGKVGQFKDLQWESGGLEELLKHSAVVISAGTSSAIEAICYGVPVVLIGQPAGLDMNPLEGLDQRLWRIVYDAQSLKEAIVSWSPRHPVPLPERLRLGRAIRDTHFARVADDTMEAFRPEFDDSHAQS